jgi:hypothetical protein
VTALRVLLVLGSTLPSCAATSGREWLESPIDARDGSSNARADVTQAVLPSESRPRLRQTVTLGESYDIASEPSVAAVGGPVVQVNVHTQVNVNNPVGYGYAYGYGSPYGYPAGGYATTNRVTPRAAAAPKVGADFPAPPSYGPRALR